MASVSNNNSESKYTTLILGAGASQHLGYPLGRDLVKEIYKLKGKINESSWSEGELNTFFDHLREYEPDSIDEFLERQQNRKMTSQVNIGKFLISCVLKDNESKEKLFHDSGWYKKLRDYLMDGDGNFKNPRKPLAVITFNYDRSLEAYLHRRYYKRCEHKGISWEDSWTQLQEQLPIIHVHGMLGSYPEYPYEIEVEPDDLLKLSKEIKIIHEISDSRLYPKNQEGFSQASELLSNSDRIVFMGFGFHKDNFRRLGFLSKPSKPLSFYKDGDIKSNINFEGIRLKDIEILASCKNISSYQFNKMMENIGMPQLTEKLEVFGYENIIQDCNWLFENIDIFGNAK